MEAEDYSSLFAGSGAAVASSWQSQSVNGETAMVAIPNVGVIVGDSVIGPRIDYSINIPTAGTWYVWVRMLGANLADDGVHVGMNGVPVTYSAAKNGLTTGGANDWTWESFITSTSRVNFTIASAGIRTLNIWMVDDGVQVDQVGLLSC